jgi:hypothetical protein
MIFVRDKGRMCNNILQYGHLFAWGREHHRATMSMRFAYKYQYFHICRTRYHNMATYLFAKYGGKLGLIPTVSFDTVGEDTADKESALLHHRLIIAEGWEVRFPKLFIQYKKEIIELFRFRPSIRKHVDMILGGENRTVIKLGVHIRRGDYAKWQNGKFFFSDEQYVKIIKEFYALQQGKRVKTFICGNDSQLNKRLYQNALGEDNVCFPDGNPGEDLCLLSECDFLIGAPSTFSLVASMYRDSPLYWIYDAEAAFSLASFGHFDDLMQHII